MNNFLTKDEELALGVIIQDGESAKLKLEKCSNPKQARALEDKIGKQKAAVEKLVENYIGLVKRIAVYRYKKYPYGTSLEDIIQNGYCGLMRAVYKYDPSRDNKFSTVAYSWIQQSILREESSTSRPIRLPENRVIDYFKLRKIEDDLEAYGFNRKETDYIIADQLGISQADIDRIRATAKPLLSLNRQVKTGDGDGNELQDVINVGVEESAELKALSEMSAFENSTPLMTILNRLTTKHGREIIIFEYNLEKLIFTRDEYCVENKISDTDYSRILAAAMKELRALFTKEGIKPEDLY